MNVTYIDATSGHKGNTSLRLSGLVFGQELKLVVLILKVPDIAVTLTSQVQTVGAII